MDKHLNIDFGCDYYHILMAQGFFKQDFKQDIVCFELFFRYLPFKGGYAIFAGLESFLQIIQQRAFPIETIELLKNTQHFSSDFLEYLAHWKFQGNIYAPKEGETVFPSSPIIRIEGNILECHLIESILLNTINYQTLVATKSSRIFISSENKPFVEMGLRRAYGPNGAFFATRAAFIGGASGSSNVVAASYLNIPIMGSMSHSWVMSHNTELEAFLSFGRLYPHNQVFLLDTYNTLKKGLPSAIQAFKILEKETQHISSLKAVRIDSGDLDYLSKKIRQILDENGLPHIKIMASDNLDERILLQLNHTQAPIDLLGVGTQLVSKFNSDLSGVYKLVAAYNKKQYWEPKIKISENPKKTTIAGQKNIIRFFNKENIALLDYVFLEEEREELLNKLNLKEEISLYYPFSPYLKKRVYDYEHYEIILETIMKEGEMVIDNPSLQDIQNYMKHRLNTLHIGHKRIEKPHIYTVGYSYKLASMTWDALSSHAQ